MRLRLSMTLLAALACSGLTASDAQAQYGLGCGGYGAWDVGRLYRTLGDRVPYFAAYPPVYYSHPVARPYGYSPFAYPPGVRTPEVGPAVEPMELINPHVESSSTLTNESDDRSTRLDSVSEPLVVINPYVGAPVSESPVLTSSRAVR